MVIWHYRLVGHEFEQALGVGNGQGRLVCCSPWGCKEVDTNEQLNQTELMALQRATIQNQTCVSLVLKFHGKDNREEND